MSKNLCLLNVCWWCDLLLWAVFLSSYYKYNFTLSSNLQSSDFYQLEIIYTVWDKIPNTDEQNLYSRSHAGELSQFYVLWYSRVHKIVFMFQLNPGPSAWDPTGSNIIGGVLCSKNKSRHVHCESRILSFVKKNRGRHIYGRSYSYWITLNE